MNINYIKELEEILNNFFYSFFTIYQDDYKRFIHLFLNCIKSEKDSLLQNMDQKDILLSNLLIKIINILKTLNKDTLDEMRRFVDKYRYNYKYLYIVDCLGLPDLYAIWYNVFVKGFIPRVKVFINVKASTEPFKRTFGVEDLTRLAITLHGMTIKRLDTILHSDFYTKSYSLEGVSKLLINRMKYVKELIPINGSTMILSDHGYDVIPMNNVYIIQHGHLGRVLFAKIAPALLIKEQARKQD